jgi:hypothetical protein
MEKNSELGWFAPTGDDPTSSSVWYALPSGINDQNVLAIKWICIPQDDDSGFVFAIDEWVKASSKSGAYEWRVRFCKRASCSPNTTSLYRENASKNEGFVADNIFEQGLKQANLGEVLCGLSIDDLGGKPRLSLTDAQDALAKYYGVKSTQIFISIQNK